MSSRGMPIDAEELLAQARWVRRLARKLVRDAGRAEDVVQDTWVAALGSAPAQQGHLRPWLARVVHNFARQSRRGETNRARREEASARPERSPPASETAERLEAQRALVEALESLAEPYRTTVTLRYLEGLSSARIARRLGVPAGTVRWRLKHGLDELRAKLEKRFGGERGSWAIALLPLLRRPPLGEIARQVAAASAEGVVMMSTSTKVVLAIGAALALSAGIWVARKSPDESRAGHPVQGSSAEPIALVEPPRDAKKEIAESPVVAERESVASAHADAPAPAPDPTDGRIEVRFVEPDARPIRGVALSIREDASLYAESDDHGRARLELLVDPRHPNALLWQVTLVAACADHASFVKRLNIEKGKTIWLGDVVLGPGGAVEGVVRGHDGSPFPGAELRVLGSVRELDTEADAEVVRRIGPREDVCPSAVSGLDGVFRIDGVPTSSVRVWAGAEGMLWTFSGPIELKPAEVRRGVDLALEPLAPNDRIEGTVLAPDGTPADSAWIHCAYQTSRSSGSQGGPVGPDGRFVVRLRYKVPHELRAQDSRGRWPDAYGATVAPGTLDAVVRFVEARSIELVVRDSSGSPIEQFRVFCTVGHETRPARDSSEPRHAEGRFALELPGTSFRLKVSAPGFSDADLGPFDPLGTPNPLTCTLDSLPRVHGRVTARGAPVPGARVTIQELAKPNARVVTDGFPSRFSLNVVTEASTAADGTFELGARAGDGYALLCQADDYALTEVSPIAIDPTNAHDSLEIALTAGGAIEGRVLPRPGFEAAGTIVAICRFDGHPVSQRVGPDGKFSFPRLTPGRWEVTQVDREVEGQGGSTSGPGIRSPTEFPWNCVVEDGQTTHFNLDMAHGSPCSLNIQMSVDGKPAAGWMATLGPRQPTRETKEVGGALDGEGRLHLESLEVGSYRLVIRRPAESSEKGQLEASIDLRVGDNSWPCTLYTGRIQGHVSPRPGEVRLSYAWGRSEEFVYSSRIEVDAEGRFSLSGLSYGRGMIERMEKGADGAWKETSMTPVDVSPGQTAAVEIP